jgi:uncharacterized protein with GYD domain
MSPSSRPVPGPAFDFDEEPCSVATFVLLSTLTDEGAQTIKEEPERIRAVNQELESMGVHVVSQWAVLGPYDFVNVVEAPDNVTIARMSANLAARGTIRIMSLPAIPIDEFIEEFAGSGNR